MKRYAHDGDTETMVPCGNGEYVLYSDLKSLEQRVDDLTLVLRMAWANVDPHAMLDELVMEVERLLALRCPCSPVHSKVTPLNDTGVK